MEPLPAWGTGDLPEPPPAPWRNAARVIGSGAILLAFSLGAGEWLLGPAATARYGATILWIATASIVLQAFLTTEMARYTLYTGEPIFTGFMRTAPGPAFWGWIYAGLHLLQIGWPGWALAAATAIAALFVGRVPDEGDRVVVLYVGYLTFLVSILLVLLGERVEKTLEYAERLMIGWVLAFLLLAGLFLAPAEVWSTVGLGFIAPLLGARLFPTDVDWFLLAGFAAYSGWGGTNATLTYWIRDKGFGMGGTVGYAPATMGRQKVLVSQAGIVFPPSEDNRRRWRGWWRYLTVEQWWIWAPGSLVAMALPALIAIAFIPPGTVLGGYGIGAHLAGALAERYGPVLWGLTLLTGFWILFSTQLANAGGFASVTFEILWTASGRLRGWRGGDGRAVFYGALLVFTLWGCAAIALADPLTLILIGANVAGANLAIVSAHTLVVNRKFLPRELRPPLWREIGLALSALFFLALALLALLQRIGSAPSG